MFDTCCLKESSVCVSHPCQITNWKCLILVNGMEYDRQTMKMTVPGVEKALSCRSPRRILSFPASSFDILNAEVTPYPSDIVLEKGGGI